MGKSARAKHRQLDTHTFTDNRHKFDQKISKQAESNRLLLIAKSLLFVGNVFLDFFFFFSFFLSLSKNRETRLSPRPENSLFSSLKVSNIDIRGVYVRVCAVYRFCNGQDLRRTNSILKRRLYVHITTCRNAVCV